MLGIISATIGALGFLGNALLIAFIFLLITGALKDIPYNIAVVVSRVYRKMRTAYYFRLTKKDPDDYALLDKYRRSKLHVDIAVMQDYLNLLTDRHGSFEVCPTCHLPHRPNLNRCPECYYTYSEAAIDEGAQKVRKLLTGEK